MIYAGRSYTLYQDHCEKILPKLTGINLIISSPEYNMKQEYEKKLSDEEYFAKYTNILGLCRDASESDARICWNVAGIVYRAGDNQDLFDCLGLNREALKAAGWQLRDLIVWNQLHSESDTAWGSFASASCPYIRHMLEYIIIGYNKQWKRQSKGESTITGDEFARWTLDHWAFKPQTQNLGHPCPFPPQLPYRCIQLLSYKGDKILDPLMGIGTTIREAIRLERYGIGIEKEKKYIERAVQYVKDVPNKLLSSYMT